MRQLCIGPGKDRLPGFEHLDIVERPGVEWKCDARTLDIFDDNSFDLIYASHIIEHIPWYQTHTTLEEWRRVLKPGGKLEVWTVDMLKVAGIILEAEHDRNWLPDRWRRHNPTGNPFLWAAGRTFAYGDDNADPNWHKALFTPKHLTNCFKQAGFVNVGLLNRLKVRGKDHGWINLGVQGTKR